LVKEDLERKDRKVPYGKEHKTRNSERKTKRREWAVGLDNALKMDRVQGRNIGTNGKNIKKASQKIPKKKKGNRMDEKSQLRESQ